MTGRPPSNSEDNLKSSLSLSGSTIVFKGYLVGTESDLIYAEKCLAFSMDGSKIACKNRDKIIVMDAESGAAVKTLLCALVLM